MSSPCAFYALEMAGRWGWLHLTNDAGGQAVAGYPDVTSNRTAPSRCGKSPFRASALTLPNESRRLHLVPIRAT